MTESLTKKEYYGFYFKLQIQVIRENTNLKPRITKLPYTEKYIFKY